MTPSRILLLAAAALTVSACGHQASAPPTTRTVTVTPSAPAATSTTNPGSPVTAPAVATSPTGTTAAGTTPASTPAKTPVVADPAVLADARVPASCQHPAARLRGYTLPLSNPSEGFGQIVTKGDQGGFTPMVMDLDGDGQDELLVDYACSAGGVSWPEYVLAYDAHGTLLATLSLGDVQAAEHVVVTSAQRQGHTVRLRIHAYEGAGFDVRDLSISVRLRGGTLAWTQLGPTTPLPTSVGDDGSDGGTSPTSATGGGGLSSR